MSVLGELGRAPLTVLLDLRYPLAYLALHPVLAFAEVEQLEVDWLPLRAPTLKAPSAPAPNDDRGIRHRRARAQAIAREVEVYGTAQGLVLAELYRDGPADAANQAWLWLRDRHPDRLPAFLAELFRAYWALELDPADPDAVAGLLGRLESDASSFLRWREAEGDGVAGALAEQLSAASLFQVPAFVVDDEVFYGRQHLPMVRWILRGRVAPVPI